VFFDLRFGFLVKNCIYDQIVVKIWSKSSQINKNIENVYEFEPRVNLGAKKKKAEHLQDHMK